MTELHIPNISTPQEIAVLVKALDIPTGSALIEQYARTVAAGAALDAKQDAYDRMDRIMREGMSRMPLPDEYAETLGRVAEEMANERA